MKRCVRAGRRFLVRTLAALALIVALVPSADAVTVERVVSPGGIEAWFVEDSTVPLLAIEFSFRGGAVHDPKGKAGLANLAAALMDEGAGELDSQAFQRRLQNLSIQLGFAARKDSFNGTFKTLNRNRGEAVRLLRLALTKARFDADAVERMRTEIISDIKRRSSRPGTIARRTWRRATFRDHPYGTPLSGTETSIQTITVPDMREFLKQRLTKDKLVVGVSGDISKSELAALLDEAFGDLPGKGAETPVAPAVAAALGDTFVVRRPVPQSIAVFGLPGLSRDDRDYYAAYVMNHILGGGSFSSWLYNEVREKRGLAYSVYSYLNPRRSAPLWMGSVSTANARMGQSVDLIKAQIQRMRDQGVSEEELKNAKLFINGSFPLRFTSTDRIASILAALQFHNLGIDYLDRRASLIDAVTRKDVARVAKRLLDPAKLIVTVVGDPQGVEPTAEPPDIDS